MLNRYCAIGLTVLFLAIASNAEIIELGFLDTPGEATDVAVADNFAYIADGQSGLRIIDISDPENPAETSAFDSPGDCYAVAVVGNRAFIADGQRGLRIVDVSDPEHPAEIGAYVPEVGIAYDVVVSGNYAYISDLIAGVRVVNVSDPENPQQVGLYDTPDVTQGVFVDGDFLFIADRRTGLLILDVSNPANPQRVGTCDTPGEARGVVAEGDFAYIADQAAGLRVIDISDPRQPREVGAYDSPGRAYGVAVAGHYAYVADGAAGLQVVNVRNPEEPDHVGNLETPGTSWAVAAENGLVYIADGERGLRIIRCTPEIAVSPEELDFGEVYIRESEELTQTIANEGHADLTVTDIQVEGRYFSCEFEGEFVIEAMQDREVMVSFTPGRAGFREGSLTILSNNPVNDEISVPLSGTGMGQVREVGYYDTPGYAHGVAVSGGFAYIADVGAGLRVVDVSDPARPRAVGYNDTPDEAFSVAVSGGFAYIADMGAGLRVIDISNPAQPHEVGYYETPGEAHGVVVSGGFAYVADMGAGLRVIDISNPAQPHEAGYYDTPGRALGVAVSDGFAYVADYGSGLGVIDVSNPAQPREAGYCDTPGNAWDVAVYGRFAYVADELSGLRVVDVSDPAQPREVGYYDTPSYAYGIAVSGGFAFVADWYSGLRLVEISNPAQPHQTGYFDTPGYAYCVAVSGSFAYVADWESGLRILDIWEFIPQIIVVDTELLDFGRVTSVESEERTLTISNGGNADLTVFDIQVEGDYFTSDFEGEFVLEPDESAEVTVTFAPETAGEFEGTLTILSDDFDRPELTIPLTGTGIPTLIAPLSEGWNLISVNVSPPEEFYGEGEERGPDAVLMMEQLREGEERHHLLLMKNEDGRFYSPAWDYNNIPYWDLSEGYQVKVDADVEARWTGDQIPPDADIPLERDWNYIAYYPTYELDASAPDFYVLSPIIDHVLIAKDVHGNFMLPDWNYSGMPPWREGQGYQVKVDEDVVLNYPAEREGENMVQYTTAQPEHFRAMKTGMNMSLLISDMGFVISDLTEIGVFTSSGLCVGSVAISDNPPWGIAVWGDDPTTDEKDGLAEGETFTMKLSDNTPLKVSKVFSGNGLVYSTDDFTVVELEPEIQIPLEYFLTDAFPNPFNNVTRLSYGLPEPGRVSIRVYDVAGRYVTTLIDKDRTAGIYSVTWEALDAPSGIYLVRLEAGNHCTIKKVMLMK